MVTFAIAEISCYVGFILLIWALKDKTKMRKRGWLLQGVACVFFGVQAILLKSLALLMLNVYIAMLSWQGYKAWKQKEEEEAEE